LLMILLHSSSNAAISVGSKVLPANLSQSMSAFVYGGWIPAITFSVIALVVILITRGRLSYKNG
jgi:CHASE2 domain-containing sensor protein